MADFPIQGSSVPQQLAKPKAPPAAQQEPSANEPGIREYTVKKGDTLSKLAMRLNMPLARLLELNPHLTKGAHRTSKGDLIYVGEKIKTQSESDVLRDQVARAKEEAAKTKQDADEQVAKTKQDADQQVAKTKQESEAKQAIADAKLQLMNLPAASSFRSADEAKQAAEKAKATLAKVPANDPERATVEKKVTALETALKSIGDQLTKLTGETPSNFHPLDLRDFKEEIRKLGPETIAIATPEQKALLIRNLTAGGTSDRDNTSKIMEVLQDAKRQGQLETTFKALDGMERSVLFGKQEHFMEKDLPLAMMNGGQLNEFLALAGETSFKKAFIPH